MTSPPGGSADRQSRGLFGRVAGKVTERVVETVQPDLILDHVDIDSLAARVDLDALLDRVDVNRLLDRVEPDRLLERVDANQLLDRVDPNQLLDRVDIEALVSRLDIHALVARSGVGGVVSESTVVMSTYSLGYAGVGLLTNAFFGFPLGEHRSGPVATWAFVAWAFGYVFGATAVSGKTLGKAIVGLRVVCASGTAVTVTRAFVRTVAVPLSAALFGLGFALCIIDPRRRTLHDLIARTAVVHDWGDRPVELSAPLSAFLDRASARA